MGDAVVARTWRTEGETGARSVDVLLSKGTSAVVTRARIALSRG
jgi:hypothetical protein